MTINHNNMTNTVPLPHSLYPLIGALILILSFTLATSRAFAGQYTIHNCPASLAPNFDAGPWESYSYGPVPSNASFQGSCTPGSTLGTAIGWYADEQNLNTNIGIMLKSPTPGITIHEVRLVWSVSHESSGSDTYAQVISDTGSQFIVPTPYVVGTSNPTKVSFPAGTREVYIYSYCSFDQSTNCYFPSELSSIVRIEGMDTTLEDDTPPTATIKSGSLAVSGSVTGTGTLQFTATDSESGVRESQLLIDGNPVSTDTYSNQCNYTSFSACPQSETGTLTFETSKIANGAHEVALRITDAAGNMQTVDNHTLVFSNESPVNASPPPPPCDASPQTHTSISVTARHNHLVSNYNERTRLSGQLVGPRDTPISGATVEMLTRSAVGQGSFSLLRDIKTHANGHFNTDLPVGITRTICLRYRPLSGGNYAAALTVTQQVRAGVSLTHHIQSNGTIIFNGGVHGGYIPSIGKVTELQVHYLGSWRVFRTLRTNAKGEFASFYSFIGGEGIFAFRACVRTENDYPFIFGCSRPVLVRAG